MALSPYKEIGKVLLSLSNKVTCATTSSLLCHAPFASFIFHCTKGGKGVGKLIHSSLDGLYMMQNICSPFFSFIAWDVLIYLFAG
jgi:hypothetical protein